MRILQVAANDLVSMRCLVIVAILVTLPATALAVTPATLIGPDLQPRAVKVQALGDGKITYFDAERRLQIESTASLLQVRFGSDGRDGRDAASGEVEAAAPGNVPPRLDSPAKTAIDPPAPAGKEPAVKAVSAARVDLIDGQRLVASPAGADDDGQTLWFDHPILGKVAVKLDAIQRLLLDPAVSVATTPAADRVLLANGDALEGFVVAIKPGGVELQQGNAKPFLLPLDRVKAVLLTNPPAKADKPVNVVVLRDGTRLTCGEPTIASDMLTATAALTGKALTLPLAGVDRIELASPRGRLMDLAELPMKVTAGGEVFGLPMAPRVEGHVLRLHAPVTVELELPPGAVRLAAVAELDADGKAADDSSWASYFVHLKAADALGRHAIHADQPRIHINVPISGRTLTITLDPGANGPVMDRLRLREAVVFVEQN
jgi:hypothetical protein